MDRRRFLGLAAGSIAGVGAVGVLGARAVAGPVAAAAVPQGAFDVQTPSQTLFAPDQNADGSSEPQRLKMVTGWQSFAFDDRNSRLYYVQPHEDEKYDLVLSWIHVDGSHVGTHYMRLSQFGHGQMMGVEQRGSDTYVWVETAGEPFGPGDDKPVLGTKICCLKYTDGVTATYHSSEVGTSALPGSQVFALKPGSKANSCSIDTARNRLLLRYNLGSSSTSSGTYYYALYDLADVRAHGSSARPINDAIPESVALGSHRPFQGAAVYGGYGYTIAGTAWPSCEPGTDDGNIYLSRFLLSDPSSRDEVRILTSRGMKYREPEGVGLRTTGGRPLLCCGLMGADTCGSSGTGKSVPHHMGMYFKDSYQS